MAAVTARDTVPSVSTTVIGTPAAFARSLARRAYTQAVAMFLIAAGLLGLSWSSLTHSMVLAGILAVLALGVGADAGRRWSRGDQARVGVRSERQVAKVIARSGHGQVLLNGMMLGAGGDCDHIVLGPFAAVIETKTGFSTLRVRSDGVYSGSRKVGQDTLGQVKRQAQAVASELGVRVTPIVCVAQANGGVIHRGGVVVCNARDLPSVLASLPHTVPAGLVEGFSARLVSRNSRTLATRDATG